MKLSRHLYLFGPLLFFACSDGNDTPAERNAIFNTWDLTESPTSVELVIRPDSTFHVDVLLNEGIEIEGRLLLDFNQITFINVEGTDSIARDPSPGIYRYEIIADTVRFSRIDDPLSRRGGFLSLPWVRELE